MNQRERGVPDLSALYERPRAWIWCSLLIAVVACGLLLWLNATHQDQIDHAIARMQTIRSARVDLAKGALKLQSLLEGEAGALVRTEGWALVAQARSRLEDELNETGAFGTSERGGELAVAELGRLVEAYRIAAHQWIRDGGDSLSLRMAHADLERFADALDDRERAHVTAVQDVLHTEFLLAMTGVIAMLGLACSGVFIAGREQARAIERTRTAARAGGVDLWEENLSKGWLSWWQDRSEVLATEQPPKSFQELEARAVDAVNRRLISDVRTAAMGGAVDAIAEVCLRADSGASQWAMLRASCVADASGTPQFLTGALVDVSSRKREELARTEAEMRYLRLSDVVPIGLLHASLDGHIRSMNRWLRQLVGYTESELSPIERWWQVAYPDPEYREICRNLWNSDIKAALARSGQIPRREYCVRTKSGEDRLVEVTGSVLGNDLLLVVQDITESRQVERSLRESEERFRQMAETIGDVFWMVDAARESLLYVSPAYERIWGRSCAHLTDNPNAWTDSVVEEDRSKVEQFRTDQSGLALSVEYRIRRPDGELRWISDNAFPLRNDSGVIYRIVGVARDVSEKKFLEERSLRSQRMEAVGTLASGIAHDLNNVLSPMLMVSEVLGVKLSEPADRKLLELARSSVLRGASIVGQLLTFSRGGAGNQKPVRSGEIVNEMAKLAEETFPRNIDIRVEIQGGVPLVLADPNQLHQVVMNLCVNARDAMPDGGTLSLKVRSDFPTPELLARQASCLPVRHVVVSVGDTGHGIPDGIRARIFDPFFTTKDFGKGTGLGLSTVLGIVKGHGGFVDLVSEVGKGSVFEVHLPAIESEANGAPRKEQAAPAAVHQGGRVLLVEDEEAIRVTAAAILTALGYTVLAASNGVEGAAVFRRNLDQIQVVVSDVMMPGMDGWSLAAEVRSHSDAIPIILTSGLDGIVPAERLSELRITAVLGKPFTAHALLGAVADAIAGTPKVISPEARGDGS